MTYSSKTTTQNRESRSPATEPSHSLIQDKRATLTKTSQLQQAMQDSPVHANTTQLASTMAQHSQAKQLQRSAPKPNKTGLPDQLKSGIEQLSGMAMDHVRVHYNSSQPAQLNAHAYAQGSEIHVAAGQEQHLPHEAWHLVQQAQGRVKPTLQMKADTAINDDASLEHEADVMGAKAARMELPADMNTAASAPLTQAPAAQRVVQRVGGNKAGYDPEAIAKPEFKLAVKNLFAVAREVNKIRKLLVTKKNNTQLGLLPEKQRGPQVKNVYAADLSEINLDVQWLHTLVTDKPKITTLLEAAKNQAIIAEGEIPGVEDKIKDSNEKVEVKPAEEKVFDKTWVEKVGETRPEAKILTGKALFVKKTVKDESKGVYRDIYKKLGKEDGDNNEYILDDLGNHTRRYAYMEKSYYQWMAFKEKGFLTGKKQDLVGAATGVSGKEVDPTDFETQGMKKDEQDIFNKIVKPDDTEENRKIALAHMHQWKGSGPGQRGLSLTSTDKDEAIYGNSGESFKSADGAKFKIDLAKTNPADNILVNHYSNESQTRKKLTGSAVGSDRQLGGKYQYERSVIKNRELYLQNLTPDAVVSITPHTVGMNVDRDSAVFNKNKKDAIEHGDTQRDLDAWIAYKKTKQEQFDKATRDKASAEQSKKQAEQNKKHAATQKELYRGDFRKYKLDGFKYPISYFNAWKSDEEHYAEQILIQAENIRTLSETLKGLQPELDECDEQIRIHTALLKTKPDGSNIHASRGWATGEAYTKGYDDGLIAIKGKTFTKEEAIDTIFDRAYEDASKKAQAQKSKRAYAEKHSPYWEGFGAALKTAIRR